LVCENQKKLKEGSMKYVYKQTEWGKEIEAIELSKQEFQDFILYCLENFLKNWEYYFSSSFERILEGYDASYFRINLNKQQYTIENEQEFIQIVKKLYGDLGQQLLTTAKKEIIK
jgi:hypothetical protein